jgi:hypothetical protein
MECALTKSMIWLFVLVVCFLILGSVIEFIRDTWYVWALALVIFVIWYLVMVVLVEYPELVPTILASVLYIAVATGLVTAIYFGSRAFKRSRVAKKADKREKQALQLWVADANSFIVSYGALEVTDAEIVTFMSYMIRENNKYFMTDELLEMLQPYIDNQPSALILRASGRSLTVHGLILMQSLCIKRENRYFSMNTEKGYIERE